MLGLPLTAHAAKRCRGRGIPKAAIAAALDYGTRRLIRGAEVYTLGWREVGRYACLGLDLSRFESTSVVCAHSGAILTVYRNRRVRRGRL
jgi:hypothetical protein